MEREKEGRKRLEDGENIETSMHAQTGKVDDDTHTHTCIHMHTHPHVYTYKHMYTHMHINMCIHRHTQTHTHTCTHTSTHDFWKGVFSLDPVSKTLRVRLGTR